jgi:hypothetical protein
VFFRSLYLRIHDYSMRTIYTDGSWCRSKRLAALLDTSFHLLALILLVRQTHGVEAVSFAAVGLVSYFLVFTPGSAAARAVGNQRV